MQSEFIRLRELTDIIVYDKHRINHLEVGAATRFPSII